jgi:hypothetical protein
VLYESERASGLQEGAVGSVRERRKRRLETEQLFARAGDEVLTEVGILLEAHPLNALEDAGMARRIHRVVEGLFDAPAEAAIKGADGAAVLEEAARHAVEAGGKPDPNTVDGSVMGPGEAVVEALHTAARHDAAMKGTKAEKAEAEMLAERRDRILPDRADLEKIARYEAHLSRQMYQALHELEALQARQGRPARPPGRANLKLRNSFGSVVAMACWARPPGGPGAPRG